MITYTIQDIQNAILKVFPVGSSFYRTHWEDIKWKLILNDGFDKQGFLSENDLFIAIGELRNKQYFERHRNPITKERFYIRIK